MDAETFFQGCLGIGVVSAGYGLYLFLYKRPSVLEASTGTMCERCAQPLIYPHTCNDSTQVSVQ